MEMAKYLLEVVVGVLLGIFLISLAAGEEPQETRRVLEPYVPLDTATCVIRQTGAMLPCIEMAKEGDSDLYYALINRDGTELLAVVSNDGRRWRVVWQAK